MKRTWRLRTIAFVLLIAMLCTAVAGCKPRLSLNARSDEYLISAPTLSGTQHAQEINDQLARLFDPLLQSVSTLRSEGLDVLLRYQIEYTEDGTLLKTVLTGNGAPSDTPSVGKINAGTVVLPDLLIDDGGNLFGTEQWDDGMLRDATFLRDLLLLSALHVEIALADYRSVSTEWNMANMAVALYEGITQKEIDTTGILPSITDSISAKAYSVGLFPFYEDMPNLLNTVLWPPYFYAVIAPYVNGLYDTQYTDLGRVATVRDALDYLDILLSPTGLLHGVDIDARMASWQDHLDRTLTRALWATMCRQCFESLDIDAAGWDSIDFDVTDSNLADVQYVLGYGLVQTYPGYRTFTPNQEIRLYQLADLASYFAAQAFSLSVEGSHSDDTVFTMAQTSRFFARLAAYCLDAGGAKDQTQRVINDRSYSFYARQADTGEYSQVNCMPTLVYMCLKWQDEAFSQTPARIREQVDPDGTGGWTLWMAKQALMEYDGRFEEWYLSGESAQANIDKIVEELDQGNVLFCMIHEGDLSYDGHCMLVYGYERSGDSLFFYVQDPGLGTTIDAYGKPAGEGRKMEAHYAQWVTERWSYSVLILEQ